MHALCSVWSVITMTVMYGHVHFADGGVELIGELDAFPNDGLHFRGQSLNRDLCKQVAKSLRLHPRKNASYRYLEPAMSRAQRGADASLSHAAASKASSL